MAAHDMTGAATTFNAWGPLRPAGGDKEVGADFVGQQGQEGDPSATQRCVCTPCPGGLVPYAASVATGCLHCWQPPVQALFTPLTFSPAKPGGSQLKEHLAIDGPLLLEGQPVQSICNPNSLIQHAHADTGGIPSRASVQGYCLALKGCACAALPADIAPHSLPLHTTRSTD